VPAYKNGGFNATIEFDDQHVEQGNIEVKDIDLSWITIKGDNLNIEQGTSGKPLFSFSNSRAPNLMIGAIRTSTQNSYSAILEYSDNSQGMVRPFATNMILNGMAIGGGSLATSLVTVTKNSNLDIGSMELYGGDTSISVWTNSSLTTGKIVTYFANRVLSCSANSSTRVFVIECDSVPDDGVLHITNNSRFTGAGLTFIGASAKTSTNSPVVYAARSSNCDLYGYSFGEGLSPSELIISESCSCVNTILLAGYSTHSDYDLRVGKGGTIQHSNASLRGNVAVATINNEGIIYGLT